MGAIDKLFGGALNIFAAPQATGTDTVLAAEAVGTNTVLKANINNAVSKKAQATQTKAGETDTTNKVNESSVKSSSHVGEAIPKEQPLTDGVKKDLYRFGGVISDNSSFAGTSLNGQRSPRELIPFSDEGIDLNRVASIRLMAANELIRTGVNKGQRKSLVGDKNNPGVSTPFTKFFLQSVGRARQERMQILETFTSSWVFFFGERTPIYTFSGILLKTKTNNWFKDFLNAYLNIFRGSKAVEREGVVQIRLLDDFIEGFIFNMNANINAMSPYGMPFSFNMVVLKEHLGSFSSDTEDELIAEQIVPVNKNNSLAVTQVDVIAVKRSLDIKRGTIDTTDFNSLVLPA